MQNVPDVPSARLGPNGSATLLIENQIMQHLIVLSSDLHPSSEKIRHIGILKKVFFVIMLVIECS